MALAMKVISQVEAQRKILEEAVSTALELASGKSDGAEVAVSKTTGISVSTRYGEVENVEFNSDGALGITVYHQNRKGSASSTDLSPQAIARTVQAALDIARYTSPDPCAGLADKELHLQLTDSAKAFVVENGYDPVYGARPLKRYLQKNVETLAARLILSDGVHTGDEIYIDLVDGALTASARSGKESA